MRQVLIFLLLFYFETICNGFTITSPDSLNQARTVNFSAWYHHGYLFPHTKAINYFTNDNINGIQLEASKYFPQLNPGRPPEIGIGYYHSNLGSKDVFGNVHGIYINMAVDYLKGKAPVYLHQTITSGFSYLTKHFDIQKNYLNRAIGSSMNAFIEVSLDLKLEIGNNILLSVGPTYVHMSNGNLKMPNFGLNLINTRLGMTYRFDLPGNDEAPEYEEPVTISKNRYLILANGGVRQLSRNIPENFFVGTIVTDYSRLIHRNQALGLGFDFVLDPTEGRERYVTGKRVEDIVPWHIGVHLSWERIWRNFSIVLQPGYKIITLSEQTFYQYNRVGIRYHLDSNIVMNISIKAQGVKADFFEFGLGYRFQK